VEYHKKILSIEDISWLVILILHCGELMGVCYSQGQEDYVEGIYMQ
jgi:hypothetical protein